MGAPHGGQTARGSVVAAIVVARLDMLAVRPFARPVPSRTIGAVWRKSSARTAVIAAVCEQIARHSGMTSLGADK